jgi:hypothetical protein
MPINMIAAMLMLVAFGVFAATLRSCAIRVTMLPPMSTNQRSAASLTDRASAVAAWKRRKQPFRT